MKFKDLLVSLHKKQFAIIAWTQAGGFIKPIQRSNNTMMKNIPRG